MLRGETRLDHVRGVRHHGGGYAAAAASQQRLHSGQTPRVVHKHQFEFVESRELNSGVGEETDARNPVT